MVKFRCSFVPPRVMMSATQLHLQLLVTLAIAGTVLGNYGPPRNLTYATATKGCVTELKLTWSQPITNLTIENYIITYYSTQPYNGNITSLATPNNNTEKLISLSASISRIRINISGNFSNGDSTYQVGQTSATVSADTKNLECNTTKGKDSTKNITYVIKLAGIIFSSAVGLLIFVFAIFRVFVWQMRRRYDRRDLQWNAGKDNPLRELDHQLPISAENVYDHVSVMKFNDNRGFKREFAKLADASVLGCSFGNRSYNAAKNRYANVPVFDKSRVVLETQNGDPSSSYINANYVDSHNRPKAYIATQAPLPETISDFWRMVWEKQVNNIVMILNAKEKQGTLCAIYWQEDSSITYGRVIVRHLETLQYADYVIRVMELRHVDETELRLVRQFNYTSWPTQRAVPFYPTSFLEFVKRVASFKVNNDQPVVVHCSSGNGRTGVYITLDMQLRRLADSTRQINVYYDLDCARKQRFQLIKKLEEYIFIHDCILDHIMYESRVAIDGRNITGYIAARKERDPKDEIGFSAEFDEIVRDITTMKIRSDVARLAQNSAKNRFDNILPFDHTRVKLKQRANAECSHYINASFVDSLTQKRNFIITQSPMEETLYEFTCMLWETGCLTVVMLSFGEKDTVPYWPEKNEVVKAGKLRIRLISREKQGYFEIRNLEIMHNENSETRLVRQYHYETWPDNSNEASVTNLVNFAVQCVQWNKSAKSRTMVVHCRAGTGMSGVVVAICKLIEELNCEGAVNVIQTVRRLRQCRVAAIQTLSQYELIYHAIASYYRTHYLTRNQMDAEMQMDELTASSDSLMFSSIAPGSESIFEI